MRASIYGHHPSFARLPGKAGDRDAYLDNAEQWVEAMWRTRWTARLRRR